MLQDQVLTTIGRHAMFWPGAQVGVAVSGGADSVALLHVLVELAPRWNLRLRILHLNHLLRGEESAGDAAFVRELAGSLGLDAVVAEADVARLKGESGENLEQAARTARLKFFCGLLDRGEVDRVATGHTRSDQAETVLYRLLRGAGTAGLAGIRPKTTEGIVRPLIDVSRSQVREYLTGHGIAWREDSTNTDPRFDRNRIRHELLPRLRRDWNPAIDETLAGMAVIAARDEEYWEAHVGDLAAGIFTSRPPALLAQCGPLRELPDTVVCRLLRFALQQVKGDLKRIDFRHVESLLELVRAREGDGRVEAPGIETVRSFDWLRMAPAGAPPVPVDYVLPLPVPGTVEIPQGGGAIHCDLSYPAEDLSYPAENEAYNEDGGCGLDWEAISGPLEVRNWRPGDQFRPTGEPCSRKMKEWFQRDRIPSWERPGWPMVTSGNTVLWTRRYGVAQGFGATPASRQVLRLWDTGPVSGS